MGELVRPICWSLCSEILRRGFGELGAEVTLSTTAPLVRGPYTTAAFVCPHGVEYWAEPTGEQIADWVERRVP